MRGHLRGHPVPMLALCLGEALCRRTLAASSLLASPKMPALITTAPCAGSQAVAATDAPARGWLPAHSAARYDVGLPPPPSGHSTMGDAHTCEAIGDACHSAAAPSHSRSAARWSDTWLRLVRRTPWLLRTPLRRGVALAFTCCRVSRVWCRGTVASL